VPEYQFVEQPIIAWRPPAAFPPGRERSGADQGTRFALQYIEIVFQVSAIV
jgi:hypothetical protein